MLSYSFREVLSLLWGIFIYIYSFEVNIDIFSTYFFYIRFLSKYLNVILMLYLKYFFQHWTERILQNMSVWHRVAVSGIQETYYLHFCESWTVLRNKNWPVAIYIICLQLLLLICLWIQYWLLLLSVYMYMHLQVQCFRHRLYSLMPISL